MNIPYPHKIWFAKLVYIYSFKVLKLKQPLCAIGGLPSNIIHHNIPIRDNKKHLNIQNEFMLLQTKIQILGVQKHYLETY